MSYSLDKGAMLVDALKVNEEHFELSNYHLPSKKSLYAIKDLETLENALMKFAQNPGATTPELPQLPPEPNLDGMTEEQVKEAMHRYNAIKQFWIMQKEAHELKIDLKDYISIKKYTNIFRTVLAATPAIKGRRFKALTKNVDRQDKGGILAALSGDKGE